MHPLKGFQVFVPAYMLGVIFDFHYLIFIARLFTYGALLFLFWLGTRFAKIVPSNWSR